ncbi:FAD-dependent oxidoreductase [Halalkalibacillus sediminis]|uniref:FAD-dependent oxidoreductase n=1 Tax=Halalkalibacillus sediminis TaxID=2018042 RepID=A0A2I0QQS1_9BACI|nr:NAD(P)/FAD-dependent oxidoreductase [Halalkalibacillus sediminis]PKR76669.1 FAD-dependent oxidoreductase [Halalkalibacillus sediminis]
MKIAIIGAGLAGLTCAITLEKHGYQADIFEKRGMVGDRFVISEAMFSMFHTPYKDAVKYFSEIHDIHLKPSSNLQKIYIHSENETSFIEGHLGFTNMRGKHPEAYEKQLADQLQTKIHYNQEVSYEKISKEYTHVVLATGDAMDTKKLQPFDVAFKATFKGAIIEGNFIESETHTFFNNNFAPKGMSYILPHSDTEASLVLVYPQYPENEALDKEELWQKCLSECAIRLDQEIMIVKEYSLKDYRVGKIQTPRIGNTFFVGNCFGAITPLIGFGEFESMLTGIYAAHDIVGIGDYEELVKPLNQSYHDSLSLRRSLEKLDNQQLDLLTKAIDNKTIESLITNKNINLLKILGRLVHPFSRKA